MALGQDPVFHGPKLDWTQDHKSYDRYTGLGKRSQTPSRVSVSLLLLMHTNPG